MNGAIKHNLMFRQRMAWNKLRNGYGPACFRLAAGLHNRRFYKQKSRVMDNDPRSFIHNLKRALIIKHFESECNADFENPILSAIQNYHENLLNFNRTTEWIKIDHENFSTLDFPPVTIELDQNQLWDNLLDNNVYWASVGPYEVRAAATYLNTINYQHKYFEAQLLDPESDLYKTLQDQYFPGKATRVIRLRIPSSHKPQGFNNAGYKIFLGFNRVVNFIDSEVESFLVDKVSLPSTAVLREQPDYYFRHTLEFSFCSCKTGRRTMGLCAHRMAALMFFGSDKSFEKKTYKALDASSYRPSFDME